MKTLRSTILAFTLGAVSILCTPASAQMDIRETFKGGMTGTENGSTVMWSDGGDAAWVPAHSGLLNGDHFLSGDVNDDQTSELIVTVQIAAGGGDLFLLYTVDSEENSDSFEIDVDSATVFSTSGSNNGLAGPFGLSEGERTITFRYNKDGSGSIGADAVAIDNVRVTNVVLPLSGWDEDDFIVAGFKSQNLVVFDSDFTFKGVLDGIFDEAAGLDFDDAGNLVAISSREEVRVFDSTGAIVSSFTNSDINSASEIAIGPAGNYYVSTHFDVRQFTPDGQSGNVYVKGNYTSVAVLPGRTGGVLWCGGVQLSDVLIFDIESGSQLGSLPLDNGQQRATSMCYSPATHTVLLSASDAAYERQVDGTFVRSFTTSGFDSGVAITRGPQGDVFVADSGDDGIYRFAADGTFIKFIDLSAIIDFPYSIVWAGNISTNEVAENVNTVVQFGTLLAGGVSELEFEDDQTMNIRSAFGFLSSEPNLVDLRVFALSEVDSPTSLDLKIVARLNNPGGQVRVRMRDQITNSLATVANYSQGGTTETTEVISDLDATRFVSSGGLIEVSIKPVVVATFSLSGFIAFYDQIEIAVE